MILLPRTPFVRAYCGLVVVMFAIWAIEQYFDNPPPPPASDERFCNCR